MKVDNNAKGQAVQVLRHRVAAHIAPYRALVLAFSGGLDSTVLLDILVALRAGEEAKKCNGMPVLTLRAVHVHHDLSRYADRWVTHCAQECLRRAVAFSTERIVLTSTPDGIEAAARCARYHALAATLANDEVLLTAQHQDDQAETLLLALKRGSGPAGLAAMAEDLPFRRHRLLRPMLGISRVELEAYERERGLRWIKDDSNSNLRFDRNFLRLRILPLLRQRWPRFAAAAARSAKLCAEQEQLLDELLEKTLSELTQPDGSLRVIELMKMSDIKRAALLRRWLASCGVRMPARQTLSRLWHEVGLSRRDAVAQLQLGDRQVRRFRNRLYVSPRLSMFSAGKVVFFWPLNAKRLILPLGLGSLIRCSMNIDSPLQGKPQIDLADSIMSSTSPPKEGDIYSRVISSGNPNVVLSPDVTNSNKISIVDVIVRAPLPDERVSVRFGHVSGRLYIIGRRHGRMLKKIWQELDIPPWQRRRTPLVFYNDKIIAALGVFVTREGAPLEFHEKWHLFWQLEIDEATSHFVKEDDGLVFRVL
ncbi:MAG: tRNA lysidine(34) synthetase TilS [Sodalis sp. (in: enterobacteria)]